MIKLVLFDIDGLLIDSIESNFKFNNSFLKKFFEVELTFKEYKKLSHFSIAQMALHMNPELSEQEIKEIVDWASIDVKNFRKFIKLTPHVKELLEEVYCKFKMGVVTNRIHTKILERFEMEHYFEYGITVNDVKNPKPHSEPLLLACKKFGIEPKHAIYIGDTNSDAQAAKAAGMISIIYKNKEVDADFHIKDLREVIPILKKLNGDS